MGRKVLLKRGFITALFIALPLVVVMVSPCVSAQGQTVNIMLFYERVESLQSFDVAIEYARDHPALGVTIGEVYKIMVNGSADATELIEQLCEEIDATYQDEDKRPDIIVDFTRHDIPSETVKMLAKVMSLPTVSASFGQQGDIHSWKDLTAKQKKYLIHIVPPADVLPQAVRSLVSLQDMHNAVLLFDHNEYELTHKYKSLFRDLPTRGVLAELEISVPRLRRQIVRLVHVDITNYFIAASPPQISEVLTEASDPYVMDGPYFSDEYAWYSMSMEPGVPSCGYCKMDVSVIHLEPKYPDSGRKRNAYLMSKGYFKEQRLMDLFYFDLTFNALQAVAKMKRDGSWTAPPKRVCKEQTTISDTYELNLFDNFMSAELSMENLLGSFHFDDKKTVGKGFANFEMTIRRLVFKREGQKPFENTEIGTWQAGFGERELILMSPSKEQQWQAHLAIVVYRVVTVVQPPFVYKHQDCRESTEKYSRCFTGFCIDLLDAMAEELKFNFTIRNVSKYGYMEEYPPHQWSGMIRELKDRKADIALGALSVMPERENVVDFTEPFYDLVGYSILMRKPRVHTSLFKFLTVLENDVWLCMALAYFVASVVMWIFDRFNPYSYQNNKEEYGDDEEKRVFGLKECMWFCIMSLVPQGGGETPKPLSARLVAITWWLFGFIVIGSYTANLAAFLLVSRLDAPIENLDDLTSQYKVQYAPLEWSSAWIYFDRMALVEYKFHQIWKDMSMNESMGEYERSQLAVWNYPVSDRFTKLWQAMQENSPPRTIEEAIDRVRGKRRYNDGFALIDEATNIQYQTLISCDFQEVGEQFAKKPYAIAVQKGSPLKAAFSHMILKFANQRILEKLKDTWWDKNPLKATCPKTVNYEEGVSIHNIGGVFYIILAGVLLAAISMPMEYVWYCWRSKAYPKPGAVRLPPPNELNKRLNINIKIEYTKSADTELPSVDNAW